MNFEEFVSLVEINKAYLYRNRFGKPTNDSFVVIDKNSSYVEFRTKSDELHKLTPDDWDEVLANLVSLRSGVLRRKMLKTWKPSYAYAFIGHFEEQGVCFIS